MRSLKTLIEDNLSNYFIISQNSNLLQFLVENIDAATLENKKITLDILFYVSTQIGYVPFKELFLLFVNLHGSCQNETMLEILPLISRLLCRSLEWRESIIQLGLFESSKVFIGVIVKKLEVELNYRHDKETIEIFEALMDNIKHSFKSQSTISSFRELLCGLLVDLCVFDDFTTIITPIFTVFVF
jgi:hypothetical protein